MIDENSTNTCIHASQEGRKMRNPGTEVDLETSSFTLLWNSLHRNSCKLVWHIL